MTKDAQETPEGFDPSKPLPKEEHELFARYFVAGDPGHLAYSKAKGKRIKMVTAAPAASRLTRLPEVSARIRFLRMEAAGARLSAPNATETQGVIPPETQHCEPTQKQLPQPPAQRPQLAAADPDTITRAELISQLAFAARNGSTSEIVQAAGALLKVMPEISGDTDDNRRRPSPDAIVRHLSTWAAAPVDLDAIMARLARIHGWQELLKSMRKGRRRERDKRKSLTGNASPSDTQSEGDAEGVAGGEGAAEASQVV